ncbi:MarR family winged helix-turn-helix transcriptional regulator [Streptantibioticus ferralitis]|uniref:MarR family transcriptional regulator n=1 Tax=Streptantibioticus ferralitis TaxID=236510 RepID=A0ABT5Z8S4_9ACTN|nr:MarR family transcriptional regulator [Streptantibioticus ferralitis]MDF2260227.1 MarR family transcriptional regulator [Streptantibioticus ferralitis]
MSTKDIATDGDGPGLPGQVPLLLAMVFRAMNDQFHARLAELGREPLRPAHGYTFRYLATHTDATTADLAAYLGITKQAASKAVAELHEWGYLERRPHPHDRRAQTLALTRRGRDYLQLADQLWTEAEQLWTDLIGADRLEAVRRDLQTYLNHTYGDNEAPLRPLW